MSQLDESSCSSLLGFPQLEFGDKINAEADKVYLQELLDNSQPEEDTINHLSNRIELMFAEQNTASQ